MLACGSNGQGQLGVGHDDDMSTWTPVVGLNGETVAQVAGGGNHTLVVTSSGKIWGAGSNANGQLGPTTKKTNEFVQIQIPVLSAKTCGAGWDFSVVVGSDGSVWQTNATGWVHIPLPPDAHGCQIACGMSHCALKLEDGSVYAWGASRHGQAGNVSHQTGNELPSRPKVVDNQSPGLLATNAKKVVCGRDFTAVLSSDSKLQIFGKFPYAYELPPNIADIYAGWTSIALCCDSTTKMIGNNRHNQLEAPNTTNLVLGSEHGLALIDGSVVTWGWGEHGNCPAPYHASSSAKLAAGCATSFIIQN